MGGLLLAALLAATTAQAVEKFPGSPRPKGDVLKFVALVEARRAGRKNAYYCFSVEPYTVKEGDFLEYDIFVKGTSPDIVGAVDVEFADGSNLRDTGARDQWGLGCHPATPLGDRFKDRWVHRRISLEKCVGRMAGEWLIAFATDEERPGVYTIYVDNVVVTNKGRIVKVVYKEGKPGASFMSHCREIDDYDLLVVPARDALVRRDEFEAWREAAAHVRLTALTCLTKGDSAYADLPDLASDGRGRAWAVWLRRLPEDREAVVASEFRDGKWGRPFEVSPSEGKYESPRIACALGGRPMVVWLGIEGGRWLIESSLFDGRKFGRPVVAASGPWRAHSPCLVAGRGGTFWIAWEAYESGRFRIFVKRFANGRWGREIPVAGGEGRNAYEPALSLSPDGSTLWIAYSVAERGEKNVYLRALDTRTGRLGLEVPVAVGDLVDGHPGVGFWLVPQMRANPKAIQPYMNSSPSVLCDERGRVWVAWEVRGRRLAPSHFYKPQCRVACYWRGRLWAVAPGDPWFGGEVVVKGKNNYFPRLVEDGSGRLWLFVRSAPWPRRAWNIRATFLDGRRGWRRPVALIEDSGKLGRVGRVAVAIADGNSFWIAWQADDYLAVPITDVGSDIYVARVLLPPPAGREGPRLVQIRPGRHSEKPLGRPRVRRVVEAGGRRYTLLFGNLHEHSVFSRCWTDCSDGTLDENYRYGMDVEGYDFMAITDHGYDLYEAAWRKVRRAAEFYNWPPDFVALPAFEWTLTRPKELTGSGHRNIIFCSDEDAAKFVWEGRAVYGRELPASNEITKVWALLRRMGIFAVTIPHHPADKQHPMDWSFHDPEYQTVVEIYQTRGSAECPGCPLQTRNLTKHKGCFVREALARGLRLGFIASGDHNSMGIGVAAVFVEEVSRRGIVEALRARRCYATTGDKIFLDFRADGHFMGEEYGTPRPPSLSVLVEGTEGIEKVEVIKFSEGRWEAVHVERPWGRRCTFRLVDGNFRADSLYYVRAIQSNGQIAWSSPIWVDKVSP